LYGGALSITLHTEKSTTLSTLDFFEHGAAVGVEEEDGEVEEGEEEEDGFEGGEYKVEEEEEEDTVDEDFEGDEEDALLGTEGGSES
jgi:hypothetical protein